MKRSSYAKTDHTCQDRSYMSRQENKLTEKSEQHLSGSLFADDLDDRRLDVVLIVRLERVQKLHVTQQLQGRAPEVLDHTSRSSGVRFTLRLNAPHNTDGFHNKLHGIGRVLKEDEQKTEAPQASRVL